MKHLHYGWVMVVIAIFVLAIETTMMYAFGIFLIPLITGFNWDRGALSGALSMSLLIAGFLGIPSGRLSDKYGPRILVTIGGPLIGIGFLLMSQVNSLWQVYLFWGLIMGIGGACCYTPTLSTIPRWFTKNSGIAMGLTATGIGLGGIITPPLAQWLISSYGWQKAFIILGSMIIIIIIPLAQFMKHGPQRIGLKPYGEDSNIEDKKPSGSATEGVPFNQAIKTGRFWVFGSIVLCFFFTVQLITTHFVPYAVDIGIFAIAAASILSITAITSVIGRNLAGFVCDRVGTRPVLTAWLATLTLALIWFVFAKEIWMLYVFAVIFGLASGGMIPIRTLMVAELFGHGSLGITLGSITFFGTLGAALGPLLAGSIFDMTGSYSLALLICVIIGALAIILSLILLKVKTWRSGE